VSNSSLFTPALLRTHSFVFFAVHETRNNFVCTHLFTTIGLSFSALKLWWGAGVVVCLEQGADLHMAQLMPLPLTVSCFSKIQIGFTVLVPAHLGSPGQSAIKWVCA